MFFIFQNTSMKVEEVHIKDEDQIYFENKNFKIE